MVGIEDQQDVATLEEVVTTTSLVCILCGASM